MATESEDYMTTYGNNLSRNINELELSFRTMNTLKSNGINTVEDIVIRADRELLSLPNFGKKSLNEIKVVLADLSLNSCAKKVDSEKKEDSEENKKSDLLKVLRFDIIDKSEAAFKKSYDEIVRFREDNETISKQQVLDIFTQHKQIVGAYERSINDLFIK